MKRLVLISLLIGSLLMICIIPCSDDSSATPNSGYTVSFDAGGGTGSMDGLTDFVGNLYLPECGFTAPPDMEFRCWLVGGENKDPYDMITITEDTVITALWTGVVNVDESKTSDDDNDPNLWITGVIVDAVIITAVIAFVCLRRR